MRVTMGAWGTWVAVLGVAACHVEPPVAAYQLSRPVRGRLAIDFSAARAAGDSTAYHARTEAWVRLRRIDTAGPLAVELEVDSATCVSPGRSPAEIAFVRAGLAHYHATWSMGRQGHVLDLSETPAFPPGEFGFRLAPLLTATLPVFFPASAPDSAAIDSQSLFDPASQRTARVQSAAGPDRRMRTGGVAGARHVVLRLADTGSQAIEFTGDERFQFDTAVGFPTRMSCDLSGTLPPDSASHLGLRMDLQIDFEALEPAPSRVEDQ